MTEQAVAAKIDDALAAKQQLWLTLVVLDLDVISFVLPDDKSMYIGRDPSTNDVVLHDTKVSRIHARLAAREGGFALQDLRSASGTKVNKRPVRDEVMLASGDVIHLGPYKLRVSIRPWRHLSEDEAGELTLITDQ